MKQLRLKMNIISDKKSSNIFFLEIGIFLFLLALSFGGVILKSFITKEPLIDESDLELIKAGKIISFIIIAPFMEEFFFRGFLNFERGKVYFVLFVIAALFIVSMKVNVGINIIIIVLSVILFLNNNLYKKMTYFISKYLIVLVIFSSVCFGLLHFINYEYFKFYNLLVITPKILLGFFAAYITIRYNIWVALICHSINNLLPTLLIYFTIG